MQNNFPKVAWGDKEAANSWQFKYLGSIYEAGGDEMTDVKTRIAMAVTRFGKLRHLWTDNDLHINLRMRLYKLCVCSVMTYGSEAWHLKATVTSALNGANARMVSIITGKSPREEATTATRTFDLVSWIRARRLQWLGHILRLGPDRFIKCAVFVTYKGRTEGDLLMDAPKTASFRELCEFAFAKDQWRARVRALRQPRITTTTMGPHTEPEQTVAFTIS